MNKLHKNFSPEVFLKYAEEMYDRVRELESQVKLLSNSIKEDYYDKNIYGELVDIFEDFPGDFKTKIKYLKLAVDTIAGVQRKYNTTWYKVVEREITNWLSSDNRELQDSKVERITKMLIGGNFEFLIPYVRWEYENGVKREEKFWEKFKEGAYTPSMKKLALEIVDNVLEKEGHLLCCPLPTDKICGLVNNVSFHPQCVRELVGYIVGRKDVYKGYPTKIELGDRKGVWDKYWNYFGEIRLSLKNDMSRYGMVGELWRDQNFDLLDWDDYNRKVLIDTWFGVYTDNLSLF